MTNVRFTLNRVSCLTLKALDSNPAMKAKTIITITLLLILSLLTLTTAEPTLGISESTFRLQIKETILSTAPKTVIKALAQFDLNGDDQIDKQETQALVSWWVNTYQNRKTDKEICDLNSDSLCTLTDLSILLYYVEQ